MAYFSRAILNVTEDKDKMRAIESKYFSSDSEDTPRTPDSALNVYRFGGLFIITAVATWSALLIYLTQFLLTHWPDSSNDQSPFASKMFEMVKLFYRKHFVHPSSLQSSQSRVYSVSEMAEDKTMQIENDDDNSTEEANILGVVNEDQAEDDA